MRLFNGTFPLSFEFSNKINVPITSNFILHSSLRMNYFVSIDRRELAPEIICIYLRRRQIEDDKGHRPA